MFCLEPRLSLSISRSLITYLVVSDRPPLEQHVPLAAAERPAAGEEVQQGALPAAAGPHQGAQSAPRDPPLHGVQELLPSRRRLGGGGGSGGDGAAERSPALVVAGEGGRRLAVPRKEAPVVWREVGGEADG